MLAPSVHAAIALELHRAERTRQQISQLSRHHAGMTIDDSYAIQRAWVGLKKAEGRRTIGHKIGLTSRAMQLASQITEPDFGCLLDDMLFDNGAVLPLERFIVPRVEVELAFILNRPLSGIERPVSLFDVLNATDYVMPALEIIDARIEQFDRVSRAPRKVLDTIADNAANAAILLGGRPVRASDMDLRWCGALLYKNGIVEESGLAAAVLNHPANGVVWLVNKLASFGEGLAEGDIVLAGSFTRPVACEAGDVFHADYGQLGTISFSMAKQVPVANGVEEQ